MSAVEKLAREILDTRRLALGHATAPQLGNASLDGGRIDFRTPDGHPIGGVGVGDDGGFEIIYVDGPKPATPTAPTVTADAGMFRVEWDGSFVTTEGEATLPTSDLDRVEVHASMDENFVPDRVLSFAGAFSSLDGGSFVFGPLPEAGTYYFRLVSRSRSKQFSVPSERVEQELAIASMDLAVTDAWLTGEAAQTTADGKNSIFRGPDEPPVDPDAPFKDGDIWFEMTPDGKSIPNIWDETTGAWVGNDDYRQSEIERVQQELREDLDAIVVDGSGTKNFFRPTAPTAGESSEGDLWFDSSAEGKNTPHVYENGEWVSAADQRVDAIKQAQDDMAGDITQAEADAIAEAGRLADAAKAAAVSAANGHTDSKVFDSTQIADDAITSPKIKAGAVGAVAIAAESIEGKHVKAGSLLADSVLVQGSLGSTVIRDGAITTEKIAVGAITADSGIIGSINAGTITVGEMEGARIKGHTVTADKLLVGGDRNWIPNGDLSVGDASIWPTVPSGTGPVYSATDKPEGLPGSVAYKTLSTARGETFGRFPVAGATSLTFSVWVKADKPGSVVYIEVRDQDGGHARRSGYGWSGDTTADAYPIGRMEVPTTWTKWTSTMRLHPEVSEVYIGSLYFNHSAGTERDATISYAGMSLSPMIGGTLIEGGAISTEHIRTGAITAESGIIGSIDANVITVGKIMGNQLDADAINGKTITGAKIRTASSGSRVELTHNGLKQYNSLGATIVDMTAGSFVLEGGSITGSTIRTASSGARIEMTETGLKQYDGDNEVTLDLADGSLVMNGGYMLASGFGAGNGYVWRSPSGKPIGVSITTGTSIDQYGTIQTYDDNSDIMFEVHQPSKTMRLDGETTLNGDLLVNSDVLVRSGSLTVEDSSTSNTAVDLKIARDEYGRPAIIANSRYWVGSESSTSISYETGLNNGLVISAPSMSSTDVYGMMRLNHDQAYFGMGGNDAGSDAGRVHAEDDQLHLEGRRVTSYSIAKTKGSTSSNAHSVYVRPTTGSLMVSSSSRRYKQDIEDAPELPSILDIQTRTWRDREEVKEWSELQAYRDEHGEGPVPKRLADAQGVPARHFGAIAEEVDELGLSELVRYDAYGRPDALAYEMFGIALLPEIRKLRDRIEELEAQLAS